MSDKIYELQQRTQMLPKKRKNTKEQMSKIQTSLRHAYVCMYLCVNINFIRINGKTRVQNKCIESSFL